MKGQNGPLNVTDLVVSTQIAAPADLSALLVTANGTVRSDADFVFFNQPSGPGVNLHPGPDGRPAALVISLGSVPPEIQGIRAVITLDDTVVPNFGQIAPPTAIVADLSGDVLYEYRAEGLTTESVVITLELYRRQGDWQVRAVGQGYANGFAALVSDHGVQINRTPAAPPTAYAQPAPPDFAPPATGYADPGYPPPAQQYAQYPAGGGYPAQGGFLDDHDLPGSHAVSLVKGQRVNLRKAGGEPLSYVRTGVGWDPVSRGGMFGGKAPDIDLDASVVLFSDMSPVDVVYYSSLTSKDGSIRHQGDNLTGEGNGDDEVIVVDLTRIPAYVTTLLFIVTSYKGHTFEQISNAYCRLVDGATNTELARFTFTGGMPYTGMVLAKVYRSGTGEDWKMEAIGEGFQAAHPGEAVPQLGRFLN